MNAIVVLLLRPLAVDIFSRYRGHFWGAVWCIIEIDIAIVILVVIGNIFRVSMSHELAFAITVTNLGTAYPRRLATSFIS